MTTFLERVAQDLYDRFGAQIGQLQVVLPSRRACLYFRWYLSKTAQRTFLAPQVMAMNDFVMRLSDLETVDAITGVFELYQSYRLFDRNPQHHLEAFIPLGNAMLRDFSMIDKNLTAQQAAELFEHLDELKAIERWGATLGQDVEAQQRAHLQDYLSFWKYTQAAFGHFRERLLEEGLAYSGLAYRKVCERLAELQEVPGALHVAFVGFNQMSRAEEDIIAHLVKEQLASTYWDTDHYYLGHHARHEAGHFLRRYQAKGLLPANDPFRLNRLLEAPPRIRVIGVTHRTAQAKMAGQLLGELLQAEIEAAGGPEKAGDLAKLLGGRINHAAVLMPDEALLLPLLQSLPTEVLGQRIPWQQLTNLTMGLSMYHTALFGLVEAVFHAQERLVQEEDGGWQIYFRDWHRLTAHPLLQLALRQMAWEAFSSQPNDRPEADERQARAEFREAWSGRLLADQQAYMAQGRLYLALDDLHGHELLGTYYRELLAVWGENGTAKAIGHLEALLNLLLRCLRGAREELAWKAEQGSLAHEDSLLDLSYQFELTFLLKLHQMLVKLRGLLDRQGDRLSVPIFKQFLLESMRQESIPFSGEPLSPIQIMGLLESRSLDFEHVVVLSCNEGTLPQGKGDDSLLPFELRRRVGIPTYQESDSAIAYIFYRLLHRAKSITLLYTEPSAGSRAEEASRFIAQLQAELPGAHLTFEQAHFPSTPQEERLPPAKIDKTPAIQDMLAERLQKGISPSAINTFISDPLAFFNRSVLRIGELQTVAETMERHTFGTLLHTMLENLLKPYEGKMVMPADLEALSGSDAVAAEARKVLRDTVQADDRRGGNYVLSQVAVQLARRFLRQQASELPDGFRLIAQEEGLTHDVAVFAGGRQLKIKLYGKADRIDLVGHTLRVVDYKTGTYKAAGLKADDAAVLLQDPEKHKVVQLMLYRYLLLQALKKSPFRQLLPQGIEAFNVTAGFYFFTKIEDHFLQHIIADAPEDDDAYCAYVEQWLQNWAERVLDPSQPLASREALEAMEAEISLE